MRTEDKSSEGLARENTNLTLAVSTALLVAGAILSYWLSSKSSGAAASILSDVGAVLLVSAVVSVLWEVRVRRAFLGELLERIQFRDNVTDAGLSDVVNVGEIDWESLFERSREVDLFIGYGRTWRKNNTDSIRDFLRRNERRMRVFLPDPSDARVMTTLAVHSFRQEPQMVERVMDSIDDFRALAEHSSCCGVLEVHLVGSAPLYSFYRFDDTVVICLHNHLEGYTKKLPAIVAERPGELFQFVHQQIEDLAACSSHARLAWSSAAPQLPLQL